MSIKGKWNDSIYFFSFTNLLIISLQIQKELMRNQEATDESLQVALSKISNITQQYEREASRRASLEFNIKQLNLDMEQERERLQSSHMEDLEKKRREWELERDTLLTIIQKDCNLAFEQHWRQPNHSSRTPKYTSPSHTSSAPTINTDFFPSKQPLTIDTTLEPDFESGANLVSPAYSDIDDVLRETEDLIQSIL